MKNNYWALLVILFISINSRAQQVDIATDVNIVAPPAPVSTGATSNISLKSIEYDAEASVTLNPGFEASISSGNLYFLAQIVPPASYADLKYELDGSYFSTIAGSLNFKYVEKYTGGSLNYKIYNNQHQVVLSGALYTITKSYGTNYIQLRLNQLTLSPFPFIGTNESNSYYILEVANEKGDIQFLRFKYLTPYNNQ